MSQAVLIALTIFVAIVLLYTNHIDNFVSINMLNWGNGAHAAWGGSVAAGGLFQHDAPHGHGGAGSLLDSYGV